MLHQRSFEERRIRSRSADPSKRRKTDIFFSADQKADDLKIEVSEYTKTNEFAWPKNQLDNVNEENINKRLNPSQKTHAAGLSSKHAAASNKAHVIQNSNGSTSIVIEPSIVNYAVTFPTGSATNLATMVNTITHQPIRPLTSMALTDSADLNKSLSSNGSGQTKFNKSATITNLNDYTKQSSINHESIKEEESIRNEPLNDKSFKKSSPKDANNKANVITNGGNFDEELLLKKLSKLNTYESIYGKKAGANCLFNKEEVIDAKTIDKIPKQSEYKSKFKPFNTYVYVTGKGWFKPKKVKAKENYPIENNDTVKKINETNIPKPISIKSQETSNKITNDEVKTDLIKTNDSIKLVDEIDALVEEKAQPWYKEAEERRLKANEFRYKNIFGNPIYSANLEEVYKKASNNFWHASKAPKFEQLQQMRIFNSAFLPYDQHKKKMQDSALTSQQKSETDSKAPVSAIKATPSKSPRTKRATSVPPSKKSITTTPTNTTSAAATKSTQSNKVWLKPKSKTETTQKEDSSAKETSSNKVQRPQQQQNNLNKELKSAQENKTVNGRKSPPIITANPVRTTQIRTPDALGEFVGVKSPPPQDWVDKLDNEPLNWTNSTTNPPSLNSNTTYLMNEFNPSSIRSDNLADLSGLKI